MSTRHLCIVTAAASVLLTAATIPACAQAHGPPAYEPSPYDDGLPDDGPRSGYRARPDRGPPPYPYGPPGYYGPPPRYAPPPAYGPAPYGPPSAYGPPPYADGPPPGYGRPPEFGYGPSPYPYRPPPGYGPPPAYDAPPYGYGRQLLPTPPRWQQHPYDGHSI
jgi:hypothetical protein